MAYPAFLKLLFAAFVWCTAYAAVAVIGSLRLCNFLRPLVCTGRAICRAIMGSTQPVIGPAGSRKLVPALCYRWMDNPHCKSRSSSRKFYYRVVMDVREFISLDDVMEELGLGPNGGLICCMECPILIQLEENLDDWLAEELDNLLDDDFLVFDWPGFGLFTHSPSIATPSNMGPNHLLGQIELFSHVPMLRNFVNYLRRKNFSVSVVYLLDIQFMTDVTKFISGCMASLLAMVQLELPHVNIFSKTDLVTKKDIDDYLNPEPQVLLSELNQQMAPRFEKLNKALIELVDGYGMDSFVPLDLRKESSGEDADVQLAYVRVRDFYPGHGAGLVWA